MKNWLWPDGFIGDDPVSKRNAKWLGFFLCIPLLLSSIAWAHMPDRPDLDNWFMKLKSPAGGLCCDFMEAKKIADPDWDTKDGHFRVFYEGKWWDIPDDAVVKEPNRYGPALVWPLEYKDSTGKTQMYGIRCFMPGAGT